MFLITFLNFRKAPKLRRTLSVDLQETHEVSLRTVCCLTVHLFNLPVNDGLIIIRQMYVTRYTFYPHEHVQFYVHLINRYYRWEIGGILLYLCNLIFSVSTRFWQ